MSFMHLAVVGASQFPSQVLEIMDQGAPIIPGTVITGYENVQKHMQSIGGTEDTERLKTALERHGSDKTKYNHLYHSFYANILDMLTAQSKATMRPIATLEIGLGTNNSEGVSSMGAEGRPGASNRAFREYLPDDAHIYGADVDRDILYHEDRIDTAYVDQLDSNSFAQMTTDLGEHSFDLIVDDGLHSLSANLNTLLFGLRHVRPGGWVVIEDIHDKQDKFSSFWNGFVDARLRSNPMYRTMLVKPAKLWCYLVQRIA